MPCVLRRVGAAALSLVSRCGIRSPPHEEALQPDGALGMSPVGSVCTAPVAVLKADVAAQDPLFHVGNQSNTELLSLG